jgi:anti-sigma-K factor RskA
MLTSHIGRYMHRTRRKWNSLNLFWRYPEIVLTAAAYLVTTIGYPVYRHAAVAFNELAVWIE